MIDRLHNQQSWDELLALVSFLRGIGWQSIFLCDSFQLFKICRYLDIPHLNDSCDFEKAIMPLIDIMNYHYSLLDMTYDSKDEAFIRCVSFIIKPILPKKYKIIFLFVLSIMSFRRHERLLCQRQRNKLYYSRHKQLLSLYFISAQSCKVTGWALIAINLFLCGQYHRVLPILKFAMSACSSDQLIFSPGVTHIPDFQDRCRYMSTSTFSDLKRIKYKTRFRYITIQNVENIDYLLQPNPQSKCFAFETSFFLYYLRFACYHRLKNVDIIQQCLNDLKIVHESEATDSIGITLNNLHDSMLRIAYMITFDENMEYFIKCLHSVHQRSHLY